MNTPEQLGNFLGHVLDGIIDGLEQANVPQSVVDDLFANPGVVKNAVKMAIVLILQDKENGRRLRLLVGE